MSGDEYTIHNATGWDVFCDALQDNTTYNRFIGKTVKLADDITVSSMAGSDSHDFCGTFDGQEHTLTFNYSTGTDDAAPFRYVEDGCVIENLRVCGTIETSAKFAAGLVAHQYGNVTIRNCRSSVTIKSSTSSSNGDGTHGGFVAQNHNAGDITFEGCLFDGKLLKTGSTATTRCGGFVGWRSNNEGAVIKVKNSLYAPAALEVGEIWISTTESATFVRNGIASDITNSYYTSDFNNGSSFTGQGKQRRTIAAGEGVTIGHAGAATEYSVSGITAYKTTGASGDSDPFIAGIIYNNVLYAGSDDEVSLTLSNSTTPAPQGYQYGYTASAGTLSGSTLTMPDEDVTITAALAPIDWATVNEGDSEDPYMIYNKDQLLLLAHRVNGTNGETANTYQGRYFKLGANITFTHAAVEGDDYDENYEAIGGYIDGTYRYFKGKFDGDGHTVSGIRIRKTGSSIADMFQGLFGCISSGADIHDVHLTDARIKGYKSVGGIAGYNTGEGGYISGCTVTDSYITSTGNLNHGTIYGGTGYTDRLTNNYYHGCTVNGTANATGVGCQGDDITANNGALPAYRLALGANITTPPGTFVGQTEWLDTPPVDARLAPGNGFTLAGNHYFASGYVFTPGSTLASGAAQGYTPRATLGGQLLDLYTPTGDDDPLAGKAIAQLTITADCDGKTLDLTLISTRQPVTVAYIKADGTPGETSAIALDGHETVDGDGDVCLAAGTYYVGTDIAYANRIMLYGHVTLILKDGCTMNVGTSEAKINGSGLFGSDYALTIFGQTAQTGTLAINNNGDTGIYVGDLNVNGGNINVNTTGSNCFAIGTDNDITVTGGTVTTNRNIHSLHDLTISGGTVSATDPGIGIWGNDVTISGGTVTANATGEYGDGIYAANVNITGGNVTATGNEAGIYADTGITLGWNKPTDRISITASSYYGTVQVADDKKLHNGSGFLGGTFGDPATAVNGKTLRPAANATYTTADGNAAEPVDAILLDGNDTSLPAGNYLATGTLNYTHGITLTGDITLILADNCHMNVGTSGGRINGDGINKNGTVALTITSQSLGTDMGHLSVYTTGTNKNGILASALTINGGNVTADTKGSNADALRAHGTALTINGGTVSAITAGSNARALSANTDFNYNGGNVTATAPNGTAIFASNGNYTFSWRTPADRITIGATGLYATAKPATFTRLFTDADGNYYGGTLTGTDALATLAGKTISGTAELVLANAADNSARIAAANGMSGLDVTLAARTLFKDGKWNTLCLPFALSTEQIAAHTDFSGATLMELDTEGKNGFDTTSGTLWLTFKSATAIAAGVPYLVKWAKAADYDSNPSDYDFTSPTFNGVTINATSTTTVSDADEGLEQVQMVGCYSPVSVTANDKSILYLGEANTLYYSSIDNDIRSCRAYFSVPYIKGNPSATARAFRLDFGDGEQTGIHEITDPTPDPSPAWEGSGCAWYDMSGRRLSGKPTKSGVYVNGGRKKVVK